MWLVLARTGKYAFRSCVGTVRSSFFVCLALLLSGGEASRSTNGNKNVWGKKLQSCSGLEMAMAGDYLTIESGEAPSGYCTGNYTICVDLEQDGKDDLCEGMEKNNKEFYLDSDKEDMEWFCSQESLPCHEQGSESCPVESWCLSPDVFAAYLEGALDGACTDFPEIECSSVSSAAVWALLDAGATNSSTAHEQALSCLVDRCSMYNIDALASDDPPTSIIDVAGYGAALLGAFVAAALFLYRTYREPPDSGTICTTKEQSAAEFEISPNEGAIGSETSYVLEETSGEASMTAVPPANVGTDFLRMLISAVVVMVQQTAAVADRAPLALPQSDPSIQLCPPLESSREVPNHSGDGPRRDPAL